jgi:hypothetical protein
MSRLLRVGRLASLQRLDVPGQVTGMNFMAMTPDLDTSANCANRETGASALCVAGSC